MPAANAISNVLISPTGSSGTNLPSNFSSIKAVVISPAIKSLSDKIAFKN